MNKGRLFIVIGAVAAAVAVAAGAFGAHALADRVTPQRLETFKTAVQYNMVHALALLFVGWAQVEWTERVLYWAGLSLLAGLLLFSGSLYLLVLTDTPWLGAITPFGGVAFIAGWILLAVGVGRAEG